jgi:hypothetical protein
VFTKPEVDKGRNRDETGAMVRRSRLNRSRPVSALLGTIGLVLAVVSAPRVSAQGGAGAATGSVPPFDASVRMTAKPVSEALKEAQRTRLPSASLGSEIAELAADPTAYLDSNGYFFHVEPPLPTSGGTEVVEKGIDFPTGDVFQLSSKPGALKTIFIDFDGATTAGTVWNYYEGIPSKTTWPFDRDGNPYSFSASELDAIRYIWQAVAEDFAPFDVNVTTAQPPASALFADYVGDPIHGTTAVVTTEKWLVSTQLSCQSGCGGIAYINIFGDGQLIPPGFVAAGTPVDRFYGTAWAFPSTGTSLGYVATTISHEVGHNLSLRHDAQCLRDVNGAIVINSSTGQCQLRGSGYYSGHADWGPIMGAPQRTYTQWSKGEYLDANQLQDDVAIIQSKTGVRADEGSSFGSPIFLNNNGAPSQEQVISNRSDIDYFAVSAPYGYLQVNLRKSSFGYNLLPTVTIFDSGLTARANGLVNPATGTLSVSGLAPGVHYISVASAGSGDPINGFNTYGSLGYYDVSSAVLAVPSRVSGITTSATGNQTLRATWSQPSSQSPLAPFTYSVDWCNTLTGTCTTPVETTNTTVDFVSPSPSGRYYPRINVRHFNAPWAGFSDGPSVDVLTAPGAPIIQRVVWNDDADTVRVDWVRGAEHQPVAVNSTNISISDGSTTRSEVVVGTSGSVTFTGVTWANINMQVSGFSTTDYLSPYDRSGTTSTSVFLGRTTVPQTPGGGGSSRPTVPQSPGGGGGRPGAPQA